MNSLYFILFIIVIPLAIFFITIFSDSQFEKLNISKKITSFFNNLSFNNQSSPVSKEVFSLNDGIGFGFGKEFFACPNKDNLGGGCDNRNADIGIVFHKFRMNDKYSVNCSESDEFFLNDYITKKYLKQNFVNILNNLWQPIGTKFFFKELVTENEIDNLTKHYYSNPSEINHYHTDCGKYIRTKNNELKQIWETESDKSLNELFNPILGIVTKQAVTEQAVNENLIQDSEKEHYAKMDIEIIKKLLANPELLGANPSDKNEKQVLRSVFTRMTDETLYLDKYSRDLHIYLEPYIESDNSIIIEGKSSDKSCLSGSNSNPNNRPLFVMSMYHKECNIFKRTIDQFNADETCGMWLDKVNSDYNLMRKTEQQFYTLAGFGDIPEPLSNCSPYSPKPAEQSSGQTEFGRLFKEEQKLMNKIQTTRKGQPYITLDTNTDNTDMKSILRQSIVDNYYYNKEELKKIDFKLKSSYTQEEIQSIINKNIQLMNKILEYDYLNDPRIRRLKKYKNKSLYRFEEVPKEYLRNITSPVGVTEPAYDGFIRKELKFTYRELVDLEIKKIKKEQNIKLELINNVNGLFKNKLDEVNQSTQPDRDKLRKIRKQINDIISKRNGNMEELKKLKKILDKKRVEVNKPLFYAEKALPVIRANMLLLTMFGYTDTLKDNIIFKNLYDGYEICYILSMLVFPKFRVNKKKILNKKQAYSYLKMDTLDNIVRQFKQYIKVECVDSSDKINTGNKCEFTNKSLCAKSKHYQIEDIHFEDLNSEYFVTLAEVEKLITSRERGDGFTLSDQKHLEKLEMYLKDIEYKCLDCPCSNPTHHALENDYLKDNLLGDNSSDEFKKNYKHLLKFLKDNNISINETENIYTGTKSISNESGFINSIQTKHASPNIDTDIKNNIKNKITKPPQGNIKSSCRGQGYRGPDPKDYSVNDYMLNRVSSGSSDYLNSFISSFI